MGRDAIICYIAVYRPCQLHYICPNSAVNCLSQVGIWLLAEFENSIFDEVWEKNLSDLEMIFITVRVLCFVSVADLFCG